MAFFSDMSFQEKLNYFDIFYDQHAISYGVLLPLCSAILFVLLYPYSARWIYTYSATQQNKLKAVQIQIEDKTPLTQEEANIIRKVSLDQQAELQRELQELSGVNQELRQRLKQAQIPRSERQQKEDAFASSDELSKPKRGYY
ncbi:hypothetical protein [Candidatus Nitrotoga sp. 1052]|uniref:hypothetical protein n=1 Tax=Candidatus Nitrotoga sp. 1052 TaxID=2886964 RepID=UPI001EF614D0|nr:hypothetical protein [Candidatus Nitrotoga sp. 1052]CAH1070400.1 hypothetical protein NTG1052_140126 [Candidatus Nitrotoga sp. 1052]